MVIKRLLEETYWGKLRLRDTIKASWPKVDVDRVLGILRKGRARDEWVDENRSGPNQNAGGAEAVGKMVEDPIDGVLADILSGPIDATS